MSPFDINSVVFHFDDFNYGRRSQPKSCKGNYFDLYESSLFSITIFNGTDKI